MSPAKRERPVARPGASPDIPTHEEIAAMAYARFMCRGGMHGHDLEDWFEAERELLHTRAADDTPSERWVEEHSLTD